MSLVQNIPFPIRWFSLVNGNALNQLFGYPQLSAENGIVAKAGGGKTSATLIRATINQIATCATTADSVKLPANPQPGNWVFIANDGAQTVQVFGNDSSTIDAVATATGVALSAAARAFFICTGVSGGIATWVSQAGAKAT